MEFNCEVKVFDNGSFRYAVRFTDGRIFTMAGYECEDVWVTDEGIVHHTIGDSYYLTDPVNEPIDGHLLYEECVRRDTEFEDHTDYWEQEKLEEEDDEF